MQRKYLICRRFDMWPPQRRRDPQVGTQSLGRGREHSSDIIQLLWVYISGNDPGWDTEALLCMLTALAWAHWTQPRGRALQTSAGFTGFEINASVEALWNWWKFAEFKQPGDRSNSASFILVTLWFNRNNPNWSPCVLEWQDWDGRLSCVDFVLSESREASYYFQIEHNKRPQVMVWMCK